MFVIVTLFLMFVGSFALQQDPTLDQVKDYLIAMHMAGMDQSASTTPHDDIERAVFIPFEGLANLDCTGQEQSSACQEKAHLLEMQWWQDYVAQQAKRGKPVRVNRKK